MPPSANGSQCTIVWYVDDNKVSHLKASVVSDIIAKIEDHFGKMMVTRGDRHDFLGMMAEHRFRQTSWYRQHIHGLLHHWGHKRIWDGYSQVCRHARYVEPVPR